MIIHELRHVLFTLNMFRTIIGRGGGGGLFNTSLVKEYGPISNEFARDSNKWSFYDILCSVGSGVYSWDIL